MPGPGANGAKAAKLRQEAIDMADSFEKGEPYYAKPIRFEPLPEETPEDADHRVMVEIIKRATPELYDMAFGGQVLWGAQRAHFLFNLWKEMHGMVYAKPEQTHEVKVIPLPIAAKDTAEWQKRLETTQALSSSPNPDPSQN